MDEERRGWRALPPPLSLGFGLTAVQIVVLAVFTGEGGPPSWLPLANLGAEATVSALYAYGAAELAQRHTGMRRRGLQVASAAWFAALALQFVWLGLVVLLRSPESPRFEFWITVEQYGWFVVELLPFIGLAVATMRRHRALALVGVMVSVVRHPPPFAAQRLWHWLALDRQDMRLSNAALSLLGLAMLAGLAVTLAPATTMPEPGRAAVGLRRAAVGLRIRMVAVVVGTAPVLFALEGRGSGAIALYKFVLVAVAMINTVAFGWLAFGLLGAARDGALSRVKLAIAGAISLWCGAVALTQLVFSYSAMKGTGGGWMGGFGEALSLGLPLVALTGVAILASEIGPIVAQYRQEQLGSDEAAGAFTGLAARSREQQLQRDATGQIFWIITLMLASALIQGWFLQHTESPHTAKWLMLAATSCSLAALTMIARLCSAAAKALASEPGLPAARVVGAG